MSATALSPSGQPRSLQATASGDLKVNLPNPSGSAASVITPSDSAVFATPLAAIYVGVSGDITAVCGGTAVLFKGVPQGTVLPVPSCAQVKATGTTATNLVGYAA